MAGASMDYLVDGYNLLHAAGFAPSVRSPNRSLFDSARTRFLDWLAASGPLRSGEITIRVVFDATRSETAIAPRQHRGLLVEFSYRQTADDHIEILLRSRSKTQSWTVVSNDGRLRDAALSAGCQWIGCEAFMDLLIEQPRAAKSAKRSPTTDKPTPTPEELAELLQAFQRPK